MSDARPRGADAVRSALKRAAAELIAERSPKQITVRALADRARVNHGLLHQYFASKDELIRVAVAELAAELMPIARNAPDIRSMLEPLLDRLMDEPGVSRGLASAVLEGVDVTKLRSGRASVIQETIATAVAEFGSQPTQIDARVMVASIAAMMFGWVVFRDYLTPATGLEELSETELRAELVALLVGIVDWNRQPAPPDPD